MRRKSCWKNILRFKHIHMCKNKFIRTLPFKNWNPMVFWTFETRFEGSKVVLERFWNQDIQGWLTFPILRSKAQDMTIIIQSSKPFKQPIEGFKCPPNGMCNMTLERSFLWLQLCPWKFQNWYSYIRIMIAQKKKTHTLIIKQIN